MDANQISQHNQFWEEVGALRALFLFTRRLAGKRQRIEWLTQALLTQQKRPDGDHH
jgi:hypothetical protein